MRPIFEQPPLAFPPPGGAIDQAAIIAAEPRKGWKIMRAHQHIDAVDLVEREPVGGAAEAALVDPRRMRGPMRVTMAPPSMPMQESRV